MTADKHASDDLHDRDQVMAIGADHAEMLRLGIKLNMVAALSDQERADWWGGFLIRLAAICEGTMGAETTARLFRNQAALVIKYARGEIRPEGRH